MKKFTVTKFNQKGVSLIIVAFTIIVLVILGAISARMFGVAGEVIDEFGNSKDVLAVRESLNTYKAVKGSYPLTRPFSLKEEYDESKSLENMYKILSEDVKLSDAEINSRFQLVDTMTLRTEGFLEQVSELNSYVVDTFSGDVYSELNATRKYEDKFKERVKQVSNAFEDTFFEGDLDLSQHFNRITGVIKVDGAILVSGDPISNYNVVKVNSRRVDGMLEHEIIPVGSIDKVAYNIRYVGNNEIMVVTENGDNFEYEIVSFEGS